MTKLKKFQKSNPFRRWAIELLIIMLSDEEKKNYEYEFNKFDTTKSGMISDRDFINKFQESEGDFTQKEIRKLIKDIDYDNSSQISYRDFLIATLDVKKVLTKERLDTIFNKFDTKLTKTIDANDLVEVLTSNSFKIAERDWEDLILKYDISDTGYLTKQDFKLVMLHS